MEGGEEGNREWDAITDSVDMNLDKLQKMVRDRKAWHAAAQRVRHDLVTEQQQIQKSREN